MWQSYDSHESQGHGLPTETPMHCAAYLCLVDISYPKEVEGNRCGLGGVGYPAGLQLGYELLTDGEQLRGEEGRGRTTCNPLGRQCHTHTHTHTHKCAYTHTHTHLINVQEDGVMCCIGKDVKEGPHVRLHANLQLLKEAELGIHNTVDCLRVGGGA